MDLREQFVLRAQEPGANRAELAREFGISRKTAYKWLARFEQGGVDGLRDMARKPRRTVATSGEIVLRLAELRQRHPTWGPKKLRELLRRERPGETPPSTRTVDRVLQRLGEARLRKPRRRREMGDVSTPPGRVLKPNDVWTVDFKGWWLSARTQDRCEPLTVRDAASRYILDIRLLKSTSSEFVKPVFERLFQQFGMPKAIRSDNGSPFGSTKSPRGLTRLSAWWVSLGIEVHFGRPACPQDNGGHERMHRDVKAELQRRPAETQAAQQHACDAFRDEFNSVRPHEALAMKTPARIYRRSSRAYRDVRAPRYPVGFEARLVSSSGSVKIDGRRWFIGAAFAGYRVGFVHVGSAVAAWFYELHLGDLDEHEGTLVPPRRMDDRSSGPVSSAAPSRTIAPTAPSPLAEPKAGRRASKASRGGTPSSQEASPRRAARRPPSKKGAPRKLKDRASRTGTRRRRQV